MPQTYDDNYPPPRPPADRGLFIGLLLLLVWLPLPLGSNRPWAWALMELWVGCLGLLWAWRYWRGRLRLPHAFHSAKPALLLWGLWLAYVGLQLLPLPPALLQWLSPTAAEMHALGGAMDAAPGWAPLSVDPAATLSGLLKSVTYATLFVLALVLVNHPRRLYWLGYTLLLSGVFQAAYGSFMALSGLEYGFFVRKEHNLGLVTGTYVNRNHLAGYLELCLAVGVGLLIAQFGASSGSEGWRQQVRNLLAWILSPKMQVRLALVVMVIALIMTHSRMGNLAFFSSLLVAGGIGLWLSRYANRATVMLLLSLVVIDIFLVGAWFGLERVAERIEQTRLETEERDDVDLRTLPYWQDYPGFGSGLGSFYTVFPRYKQQGMLGYYDHAHNDYMQFVTETGFLGALLVGGLTLLSYAAALLAQYRRRNPLFRGMGFGVIMGLTALLIHSSVDFNLQIPANAATFSVILALAWLTLFLPTPSAKRHRREVPPG